MLTLIGVSYRVFSQIYPTILGKMYDLYGAQFLLELTIYNFHFNVK